MNIFDEIRESASDFLAEDSRNRISERLSKILNSQPPDALTIVFCGTFSSGKSSLINEMLQQKYKLPVGINPVTKFVTRLKYGKELSVGYLWHGKQYPLSLSDLQEIITGKLSLPDESVEVVISLPAKILRGGVEILDTPGFLDTEELSALTRAAVAEADIAVFCCSAAAAGKEFERDYFKELDETIGNFAVVINRMDAIDYAKDFEDIQRFMEYNVAGRGRAVLHFLGMEKLFYTVAGGKNIDITEFRKFFSLICVGMSKKFRRRLQRYSWQKRTIYALQKLRDEVQTQIFCGEHLLAGADRQAQSKYQTARKLHRQECTRISELMEKILTDGKKLLSDAAADIEREFDSIAGNDYVFDFSPKATAYLREKFCALPTVLRTRLEKSFPEKKFDDPKFFADYIDAAKNYLVPEPVGRRVETDSVGKKIIDTITSVFSKKTKTNSYETVYDDYASAAKTHLRSHLLELLQDAMVKYLYSLATALNPPSPVKDETLVEEIAAAKKEWESLDSDIVQYLTFCREKFMWNQGSDRKLFPHKV